MKKVDPRASTMAVVQKNVRVWAFSFNMEARDPFVGDDPSQVRTIRIAVKGRLPGRDLFRQNQLNVGCAQVFASCVPRFVRHRPAGVTERGACYKGALQQNTMASPRQERPIRRRV